ncbi:MAG: DUF4974 domain-containing protein [Chitinophagaceae bacterium]|nr:DUF4974 domain-containing protein [Chitinophagaceae bacterium]
MERERLLALVKAYLEGTISPSEREELLNWYHAVNEQDIEWDISQPEDKEKVRLEILSAIRKGIRPRPAIRVWKYSAVAASIILLIGLGGYFFFFSSQHTIKPAFATTSSPADINAPQTNRAMLTLANGTTVFLDSVPGSTIAEQGDSKIEKSADGKIVYKNAKRATPKEVVYNTLFNPRGSKVVNIQLYDGSKVWLNAESSITYPVTFTGKERRVTIKGEAYFEIARFVSPEDGKKLPFIVQKGDMEVKVLGTHFNVNAYDDEKNIKTTLVEGSVQLQAGGKSVLLKPGQQSIWQAGQLSVSNDVNIEEVLAWKNGYFYFEDAGIPQLMKQLSRWYNVDIVFDGKVPERKFGGKIPGNTSLSEMLKILSITKINYKMENRTLVISP